MSGMPAGGGCHPRVTGWEFPTWRICAEDKETLDLIDQAVQREPSKHTNALDNIQGTIELAPTGTSPSAALRRLRKESATNPDAKAAYPFECTHLSRSLRPPAPSLCPLTD